MLKTAEAFGAFLRAIPGPTEHWATIIAAWAWPTAALTIVYMLRAPISTAAQNLAERFRNDDIELPGFLKVTGGVPLSTLKEGAVTEEPGTPDEDDAKVVESLLEYAGDTFEKFANLRAWIDAQLGADQDAEAFLYEKSLADTRRRAYEELVKGEQR
ncbi:hypothetical protein [Erythrobacter sp.]|uniref:hypothetical protein n=1 Tax=Erythrobacter sp. TaxID=1042 RepID=UPI0025D0B96C|nr:hypothetical protein [Erythrobacter sp.]